MNNWEKLCENIKPSINKGVDEDLFHLQFESCLKIIFNWINLEHKPPVQYGRERKQADIVLRGNDFGIVIEMKRPDIELDDEAKKQLFSYMRILKCKYGFLIGKEIILFYDDDTTSGLPTEVVKFDFNSENIDGVFLCDILIKEVCSNEKLRHYMLTRIENKQEHEKYRHLKNDLISNNGARVKEILKEKLITDGYKEEKIIDIINDITICLKNHIYVDDIVQVLPQPISRDNIIEQFRDKCIIIKIKQDNVNRNNGDIYKTVRSCWNNKLSTVQQADYVLAVVSGRVVEVYKSIEWYHPKQEECNIYCPTSSKVKPCGRIAFNGKIADDEARNRYKDKWIPNEYKKPGMAQPVLFIYNQEVKHV